MDLHILYEDNHVIAIAKPNNLLVQGDATGDVSLDTIVKQYLKTTYNKPGNVFLGVVHRLDRPVSGVLLYAKTSKALARLNESFKARDVKKIYHAIVKQTPQPEAALLEHYLERNSAKNKSFAYDAPRENAKKSVLAYRLLQKSNTYSLLEVNLFTGRHHQIRAQLAKIQCPIKGDLKYGFNRSNPDGGISLHARLLEFPHPTTKEIIRIEAPYPAGDIWHVFDK